MVRRHPALLALVPLEHGKVGDPEKAEIFAVAALERRRAARHISAPTRGAAVPPLCKSPDSAGVTLRCRAASRVCGPADADPATSTIRSPASAPVFVAIFATASGNDFSKRLKSSNSFAPSLRSPNIGLISSRSLRESSPTFGMRIATTGRFAFDRQRLQILRRESSRARPSSRAGAGRACRCHTAGSPRHSSCAGTAS